MNAAGAMSPRARQKAHLSPGQRLDMLRFPLANYYEDMAALIETTKEIRQLQIFVKDAQRYGASPRGRLSAIWAERYMAGGADLASTWEGFMPANDIAIIRAQQDMGSAAMVAALRDLARMTRISKELQSAATSSIGLGLVAATIAALALTALPVWAVNLMTDAFGIPVSAWGPVGQKLAALAAFVSSSWPALLILFVSGLWWCIWSPSNWTGHYRAWCDERILLYRAHHEIHAMRLSLALASLSRRTGSTMYTLRQSIEALLMTSTSPWAHWQIGKVLTKITETGALDYTVFEGNVLTREMYWRLQDVSQSSSLPDALQVIADAAQSTALPRLKQTMAVWRWVLMLGSLALVIAMAIAMQITIQEMRAALVNSLNM
jgi:type II secretory pathway component PulF